MKFHLAVRGMHNPLPVDDNRDLHLATAPQGEGLGSPKIIENKEIACNQPLCDVAKASRAAPSFGVALRADRFDGSALPIDASERFLDMQRSRKSLRVAAVPII